jgi:DNA-directed RNA polymerase subunit M/transcription elongation factor TFIIS
MEIEQGLMNIQWEHHSIHTNIFQNSFRESGFLADCYLSVEGKFLPCHKLILAIQSKYFKDLFDLNFDKHPVIILNDDVTYQDAEDMLKFIYTGQVKVETSRVAHFFKVAEKLKIYGVLPNSFDPLNNNTDAKDNSQDSSQKSQDSSVAEDVQISSQNLAVQLKIDEDYAMEERTSQKKPEASSSGKENKNVKPLKKKKEKDLFMVRLPPSYKIEKRHQIAAEIAQEPIFKCKFCSKSLKSKKTLYNHQRGCSSNPQKVLFKCTGCSNQYNFESSMNRHKQTCLGILNNQPVVLLNREELENIRI